MLTNLGLNSSRNAMNAFFVIIFYVHIVLLTVNYYFTFPSISYLSLYNVVLICDVVMQGTLM